MEEGIDNIIISIVALIILCFICCGFETCSNEITSDQWNEGVCPKCNVQYELRAIDRIYCKYYVCPECHIEVERF